MKTIFYKYISGAIAVAAMIVAVACDNIYIAEDNEGAVDKPKIESFSPSTGVIDTEIVILGSGLNAVTRATIGGREVTISERVSDKRLSIKASEEGTNGTIVLYNSAGSCESAAPFTYIYPVPSLLGVKDAVSGEYVESTQMDDHLILEVENFEVVKSVWFTAADATVEGADRMFEAEIAEFDYDDKVIEIVVPYVNSDDASILLEYYNGSSNVYTEREAAKLTVKRNAPVFTGEMVSRAAAGMPVKLEGENLHHVQHIYVGEYEADIDSQSPESLRFIVPLAIAEGQPEDFESEAFEVRAEYFFGNEEQTLSEAFTVFVANLKYWPNRNVWAQGRIAYSGFRSFFSPETGEVYHNEDWGTLVDPVAYKYKDVICNANVPQHDKITRAEYESVNPYFFFSGANAGNLAINSPGQSSTQLRNFYKTANGTANSARITDSDNSVTASGTPVLYFRVLSETNATQKAIIEQIRSGTFTSIDETSFPIVNNNIGGISVPTSGNPNTGTWALDYEPGPDVDNFNVDAVLMVVYLDYDYAGNSSDSPIIQNIKRIGFVHIRTVNFRVIVNGANVPPSGSDITFDCYWQKRDYDYSKIAQ